MEYELILADTCLPDYWSGHHLAHISIPAYPMYLNEIKSELHGEVAQGAIAGHWIDSEENYQAFHAAINAMKNATGFRGKHFKDIEQGEDFSVYAYFVFVEKE
jgi:hypothetical protein